MTTATTEGLVELVRSHLNDTREPYLVSDAQILFALDIAQQRFAELVLPLTAAYTLAITAGTSEYLQPAQLLKIRRVEDTSSHRTLRLAQFRELSATGGDWRASTGTPSCVVTDERTGYLRLWPTPVVDGTLLVSGFARPETLEDTSVDPEIPLHYRHLLLYGALVELYTLQDLEVYDPRLAETHRTKWELGLALAMSEVERDNRGPGVVRFNGNGVW